MKKERKKEIQEEAKRRLNLWVSNSSFDDMTCGGSYLRFEMALAMKGYPFKPEEWMDKNDCNSFISDEENKDPEYNQMLRELFEESAKKWLTK